MLSKINFIDTDIDCAGPLIQPIVSLMCVCSNKNS
jgi:hypothetical protein